MIKIYKSTFWGYLLASLIVAFGLIIAFFTTGETNYILLIIVPIWIYGCSVFFRMKAIQRYQKEVLMLLLNCQVHNFIEVNEKFLVKRQSRSTAGFLKLNLCNGYLQFGNNEQAKTTLSEIKNDLSSISKGIMALTIYYCRWIELYTSTGDFELAKENLETLKELENHAKIKEAQRDLIMQKAEEKTMALAIKQNHFDGAKDYYTTHLSTADTRLGKVNASYYLALICLHDHDREEARLHLQFVIENGGDTYYTNQAKELLLQIT